LPHCGTAQRFPEFSAVEQKLEQAFFQRPVRGNEVMRNPQCPADFQDVAVVFIQALPVIQSSDFRINVQFPAGFHILEEAWLIETQAKLCRVQGLK
jgi:hypothetical protein